MSDGNTLSDKAASEIAQTVREVARRVMNERGHRGRWQWHGGGGGSVRDGIVSINHGCGWYTIELGKITDEGGSGSGSGDTDCDPCSQGGSASASASTSGCELTLSGPPSKVVGSGVFAVAYDPQSITIPLVVGTDCVVGKVSNSPPGVTPWRILRGYQEHIVEYKERWECCPDGTPKLIGKTPIIFVATVCEEIICGECPPTSGSGV
jgi:hypothetical protein